MAVDKLVDSTQLDSDLTSVANAIRTKGGTSSQLAFPAGFVSAVQDIPTGTTPTLITKTITQNGTYDAEDDNADGYSEVTVNVSGGGGISVDDLATNAAPSGAITLGSSVTQIKDNAFRNKPITSITAPEVTSLTQDCLNGTQITSITDANFPKLGASTTYDILLRLPATCTSFNLSGKALSLYSGYGAFRYNTGLKTVMMPHCAEAVSSSHRGMGSFAFGGCTNLETVDIGSVQSISANAFNGDTKLRVLILRYSSVVSLTGWTNAVLAGIYSNPTLSTIYVPNALISSYQTASNWSSGYAAGLTFAKIEGSIYE